MSAPIGYNFGFREPRNSGSPIEINHAGAAMKTAQEVRAGNVIMIGKDPMVVQKAEFNKSGRNASVVKMKLKNLLSRLRAPRPSIAPTRSSTSSSSSARKSRISYFSGSDVRVHGQRVQPDRGREARTSATPCTISRTACRASSRSTNGKPISVELPTIVVREITYTEPAVRGDTSGKVLKPAKLAQRDGSAGAAVRRHRRQDRDRHPHRRIPPPRLNVNGKVLKVRNSARFLHRATGACGRPSPF